ncbi:molecular chaperone [Desulfosporosinus sp. SB140]|uniref:TorD/DmsD family molecular chaperone n=1 Tax=Desulfosporosinus paludis TaxID=3115649 RepID=UPI003890091C
MTNIKETVLPLMELRVSAYNLLRWAFLQEPSKKFLQSLSESVLQEFPFQDERTEISQGVQAIISQLKLADFLSEENYDRLHWDYTRMFIGPYELPAPPWESAYLNEERLLFQEETLAVRRAYLKYSLVAKEYGHEADDHLGLELDFMYQLSLLALQKINEEDYGGMVEILLDQQDFLDEHLLKWVPDFCQKVEQSAQTKFYQGMAKILHGYVTIDRQAVEELISYEY